MKEIGVKKSRVGYKYNEGRMSLFFFPQILKSSGWLSAFPPPPFPNARGFCKIRMHGISEGFSYSHGVGPQCIVVGVGGLSWGTEPGRGLVACTCSKFAR